MKKSLDELKKEAGEVPEFQCDRITGVIDCANRAWDLARSVQSCTELTDAQDLAGDIENQLYDVEDEMERIRGAVEQLRELGRFWYLKYKELVNEGEAGLVETGEKFKEKGTCVREGDCKEVQLALGL